MDGPIQSIYTPIQTRYFGAIPNSSEAMQWDDHSILMGVPASPVDECSGIGEPISRPILS